jgi:leucyl/phenylalanyl-tRNA--protein transferase
MDPIWNSDTLREKPTGMPVAIGGEITPSSVWAAFTAGVFPIPTDDPEKIELNEIQYEDEVETGRIAVLGPLPSAYRVLWWCPDPRPVIPPAVLHCDSNVRRTLRTSGWTATVNADFERVVNRCRERRSPTWLTAELVHALIQLHRMGRAHSVEVWAGHELIGGLYGLARGAIFSIDSSFYQQPHAGKVAAAELAMRTAGTAIQLLDMQLESAYANDLRAVSITRNEYLKVVESTVSPLVLPTGAEPVSRLPRRQPIAAIRG